MRQRNIGH